MFISRYPTARSPSNGIDSLESWLLSWRCNLSGVFCSVRILCYVQCSRCHRDSRILGHALVVFSAVMLAEAAALLVMLAAGDVAGAADVSEAVVLAASMVAAL